MHKKDPYNPFLISHCKRSEILEKRFQQFNRDFFDSSLPRYQVLLCSKCKSFGHEMSGYCLSKPRVRASDGRVYQGGRILIRGGMREKSTDQTLIHEMVHAKLSWIRREIHGKRFVSELKRLRKLGAPLSIYELDKIGRVSRRSREPPRLTKRNLRGLILEALVSERLPPRLVPRYLEQELMIPYSVIKTSIDVDHEIRRINLCSSKPRNGKKQQ